MSNLETIILLHGGCHCGVVKIKFMTRNPILSASPRACDCSFCQKHGAAYTSDPCGTLTIACNGPDDLLRYQQGSKHTQFLMCAHCGVLLAATYNSGSIIYGAVNVLCLDRFNDFSTSERSSPQQLSTTDKISRWTKLWVPNVTIAYASA
jgi:hypothetical protein